MVYHLQGFHDNIQDSPPVAIAPEGRDGALEVEMVPPKKEVVLPKVQYVMLLPKVAMVLPSGIWRSDGA